LRHHTPSCPSFLLHTACLAAGERAPTVSNDPGSFPPSLRPARLGAVVAGFRCRRHKVCLLAPQAALLILRPSCLLFPCLPPTSHQIFFYSLYPLHPSSLFCLNRQPGPFSPFRLLVPIRCVFAAQVLWLMVQLFQQEPFAQEEKNRSRGAPRHADAFNVFFLVGRRI